MLTDPDPAATCALTKAVAAATAAEADAIIAVREGEIERDSGAGLPHLVVLLLQLMLKLTREVMMELVGEKVVVGSRFR